MSTLQAKLLEDAPIRELRRQITTPTQLLMHIAAGRSVLTVRSNRTGEYYTFRFRRPDAEPNKRRPIWVSVLGGPEGGYMTPQVKDADALGVIDVQNCAWSFLGTIWPEEGRPWNFNPSGKSKVPHEEKVMGAAHWIARMLPLSVDHLMEEAVWWHEGRCGRCGRRLTVPESIESGFGPECIKHIGGES